MEIAMNSNIDKLDVVKYINNHYEDILSEPVVFDEETKQISLVYGDIVILAYVRREDFGFCTVNRVAKFLIKTNGEEVEACCNDFKKLTNKFNAKLAQLELAYMYQSKAQKAKKMSMLWLCCIIFLTVFAFLILVI